MEGTPVVLRSGPPEFDRRGVLHVGQRALLLEPDVGPPLHVLYESLRRFKQVSCYLHVETDEGLHYRFDYSDGAVPEGPTGQVAVGRLEAEEGSVGGIMLRDVRAMESGKVAVRKTLLPYNDVELISSGHPVRLVSGVLYALPCFLVIVQALTILLTASGAAVTDTLVRGITLAVDATSLGLTVGLFGLYLLTGHGERLSRVRVYVIPAVYVLLVVTYVVLPR